MSREDPQESLPSFSADEDDAYNVPTKVGAMPADIAAQLRAEGLLPQENSSPKPPRDSTLTPLPSFASEPSPDEVTNVYAELPSQEMVQAVPSPLPPPLPVPTRRPPPVVQAPVAVSSFAAAPKPQQRLNDDAEAEIRAFGGHSRTRMLVLLIAGMVALVVLAFVMALLSQRR